jgi:cytoplasmic iron level regulating protein YaaA (DUF328/UPF0246 family)
VLIIAPPSERKQPSPDRGRPIALDELSFPELTPIRQRVLDALIETSRRPDAFARLMLGPTFAPAIAQNTRLLETPTLPASELYTGPLHEGLDLAGLSPAAAARADADVVIASSLWGLVRPTDRIPSYRLAIHARLVGMGRLEPMWRTVLPDVLARVASSSGVILDLRSPGYQAVGMPTGLGPRTVVLKIDRQPESGRRIGDVVAKRVRGQAAHRILEAGPDPADPCALADVLADHWPVRLEPPDRPGGPSTMRLTVES